MPKRSRKTQTETTQTDTGTETSPMMGKGFVFKNAFR